MSDVRLALMGPSEIRRSGVVKAPSAASTTAIAAHIAGEPGKDFPRGSASSFIVVGPPVEQ